MNIERNKKIEQILGSLDQVKRANAPAFFYTRLRARMEKQVENQSSSWALKPVYALIALFIVLLINAAVLFKGSSDTDKNLASNTETDSMQSLAAEYRVAEAGSIYDLNQDK